MTREECTWWVNHLFNIAKEVYWNMGAVEDAKEVETAQNMAIEALQAEPTHGRLIDADALMEYCSNQKSKTISNNDIARFPTVSADRPHGEWVEREDWNGDSYYDCSVCGESFVLFDGTPSMNLYHFCPNCGADMRGETKCIKSNR